MLKLAFRIGLSSAAVTLLGSLAACSSNSAPGNNSGSGAASSSGANSGASNDAGGDRTHASGGMSPGAGGNTSSAAGASGTTTPGGAGSVAGSGGAAPAGKCALSSERLRVTEVDVGSTVLNDEDEAALKPITLSPIPSGGTRVAWLGSDAKAHVMSLDANDQPMGSAIAFPAHDLEALYADDGGGVLLVTRDAQGGGTLNCGEPTNLCGTPPSPPIACYDMYLVRFDGASETWATKLTDSSAALPPYSTSKTGPNVTMIWWYAHHGSLAFDGTNYAAYYGAAISVSQNGCINIHQGDRLSLVDKSGALGKGGFDWGCSHSGYEHVIWDPSAKKLVPVCQNDAPTAGQSGRLAYAPETKTLYPVDLWYSNVSELALGTSGYWTMTSNARSGQPASKDGLADVHLLHFDGAAPDQDLLIANDAGLNARAPHLANYGKDRLIAAWEVSTAPGQLARNDPARKLYLQTRARATGAAEGQPLNVAVQGNRYQQLVSFPDGSVAFPAPGSSPSKLRIMRVLPCNG